ncbi:hypothetical protein KMZ32_01380 [Phycicoccus sp. MAQZ13P-2]|uniref:hypothetical protein n=1 Tax=Phycicoccus mangrovi TaxID=2840470 RepID=UPI001BFFEAE6|nr:hypothetical protein [Phycicoccus mangrovi]MBT9254342.1 hypothetical protein [Phycicoccus mangrovi]MBT9272720.1 hypothetical protein [Phycicoccus mangrovi]
MLAVVVTLLLLVVLAVAVLGMVAVPARRAGREVLTERGTAAVAGLRERADRGGRPAGQEPERETVAA